MTEYLVTVTTQVVVDLKDEAFTPEFMEDYGNQIMWSELRDHAETIGWLVATKEIDPAHASWEGYGKLSKFCTVGVPSVEIGSELF
jgi:hypothetical protein